MQEVKIASFFLSLTKASRVKIVDLAILVGLILATPDQVKVSVLSLCCPSTYLGSHSPGTMFFEAFYLQHYFEENFYGHFDLV